MNYIIYDTEFSQPQPKLYNPNSRFKPNPVSPFEIIEIGAVKVSENLEIIDTFSRLIKPVIYRRLSPIVIRKTGITGKDLKKGESFRKVIRDFREWVGENYILCSWSSNDVQILKKNCEYHRIDCQWLCQYYDIQKYCTKALGLPSNQAIGLKNALKVLDIDVDIKLHRALADAIHTAKVFIEVYNEEMKYSMSHMG